MSTTELIHVSAALDALQKKLQGLKDRADSLHVTDQQTCIVAKNLKLDIQAFVKAVKYQTGPDIEIKKGELRQLQEQEKMLLAPAEAMLETSESQTQGLGRTRSGARPKIGAAAHQRRELSASAHKGRRRTARG